MLWVASLATPTERGQIPTLRLDAFHWACQKQNERAAPDGCPTPLGKGPTVELLSHRGCPAVPSPKWGLTSVFGMGTGVAPTLWTVGKSGSLSIAFNCLQSSSRTTTTTLSCRGGLDNRRTFCVQWFGRLSFDLSFSAHFQLLLQHVWNEDMVKPHGRLVLVSSTCCHASTSSLSTS